MSFTFFALGWVACSFKSGYRLNIEDTEEFVFSSGTFYRHQFRESAGIPIMHPGSSMIEFDGRLIYRADRGFQEPVPHVMNIKELENGIYWSDGEYNFDLIISPIINNKED